MMRDERMGYLANRWKLNVDILRRAPGTLTLLLAVAVVLRCAEATTEL